MIDMTEGNIRKYAKEKGISKAEARKHFVELSKKFHNMTVEEKQTKAVNGTVIDLLDQPLESGFNKIFDDSKYSVYSPILNGDDGYDAWHKAIYDEDKGDDLYDTHLRVYKTILGGVESQSFNLYNAVEEHYINVEEQQRGSKPFESNEGSYRLAFLYDKMDDQIVPLFFNTWDMTEKQLFRNWRGSEMYLTGLYAAVCRTVLASIPLSGFTPNADKSLERLMRGSWFRTSPYICKNWLSTYEVMYQFGRYLMEHPDHKDQALTYYRITD